MRIGVVGGGVVGQATARCFLEHVGEVRVYDMVPERRTHSLVETMQADLIFVCLPTPQKDNSLECDVSAIDKFFHECPINPCGEPALSSPATRLNFVLRSTVPVGTTRRLRDQYGLTNVIHSPEFLTARCAVVDAQMPARNIIGTPNGEACGCDGALQRLYTQRFPGTRTLLMTSDESEAVKLFQNSIFATTVALWNELQHFSKKAGLDWERVRAAILADGRLSSSHTKVPGPDGLFGYGGACLPKDLASFVHQYRELLGTGPWVTKAAMVRNEEVDRKR